MVLLLLCHRLCCCVVVACVVVSTTNPLAMCLQRKLDSSIAFAISNSGNADATNEALIMLGIEKKIAGFKVGKKISRFCLFVCD